MSFRSVPKSVTLNDLERLMALFCVISANSGNFQAHCVKVHVRYKPNSIMLASSELAPNMFGAIVRSWFEAEIWSII